MTSVLVISPHADDEVYGCGGMIARRVAAGDDVRVVYGAVGGVHHRHLDVEATSHARVVEIKAALEQLGVVEWAVLHTGLDMRLDQVPQLELVTALDREIDLFRPAEVYLPYSSHNHDHQALHRAAIAALRPGAHPFVTLVAMYEYAYPGWFQTDRPYGRMYVDITETIDTKLAALAAYTSQIREAPHPLATDGVRTLAALRGLEAGVPYAELFHLVHWLRP